MNLQGSGFAVVFFMLMFIVDWFLFSYDTYFVICTIFLMAAALNRLIRQFFVLLYIIRYYSFVLLLVKSGLALIYSTLLVAL